MVSIPEVCVAPLKTQNVSVVSISSNILYGDYNTRCVNTLYTVSACILVALKWKKVKGLRVRNKCVVST